MSDGKARLEDDRDEYADLCQQYGEDPYEEFTKAHSDHFSLLRAMSREIYALRMKQKDLLNARRSALMKLSELEREALGV